MPNSRFALHGKRPSLIHGLCAIFASSSWFMCLFEATLETCLSSLCCFASLSKSRRTSRFIGNENSAQSFSDRSFWKPLRVVDVRAFRSWMSAPTCLFFSRILTALTEVLGRDLRANDPRMSAGNPSQKLPLWADFSFLK